ncbi:flagellar hook protein FlgE [Verminephrobacter aporrectodeae]|uniref:flagellar hook protein FlgE n=1 Tax=Verminephrobacter aporrectodeae TaxID=1110389 RepID=UPI0002377304|nr:flagellar hook protein FlgE [Verminephrobacter aporrectodeae]MCW5221704.1 flagellar hook protein FlgE [Verminephrobacter aporrectodeae subsp. tuberculatae]MCW5258016.1 flagellar hook protein FlgE [Verminephrobacter aporrectodeae subsp. tuberculatae]MCW5290994.1 flagellar hook protein FlgE [Verminephrobacter aporrectodeae subsp. tuberculatae]MCW8166690.1 flagellar hook protein FlgE [Verminephrobacter aporrectodeae subsp. tuberculatae]MCW8170482.1 flagellar hook protein FlgE [Verminephrobacte
MGFQQGLSGLNAAGKNLDVIGHNIANTSTVGFKTQRAEFAEMVASAIGSADGASAGIGVETDAIAQQFLQGNLSITGNNLDVAINGNGLFTLTMPDGTPAYTRSGNFKLDKEGRLVTNGQAHVMGYPMDPATGLRTGTVPVALALPTSAPIPAKQTRSITAALNLDARAGVAAGNPAATPPLAATPRTTYGTSIEVYDSQGVAKPVSLYFEKTTTNNTWNVYDRLDDPTATPPVVAAPIGQISFDNQGAITGPRAAPPNIGFALTLNVAPTPPNPNNLPAYPVQLKLDGVTQFGAKFAVSQLSQDGYTSGELTGVEIEGNGMITARYSNGVTRSEGQIALANFRNPQGLSDVGGNSWLATFASGPPVLGVAGEGSLGALRSGALEDSNVDLTAELVNMMSAQRAYQASAQTIKTQDQVMATLVNLR